MNIAEFLQKNAALLHEFDMLSVEQKISIISACMGMLQKHDPVKFKEMVDTIPEVFDL